MCSFRHPIIEHYNKCRLNLIVFGMCGKPRGVSLSLKVLTSVDCRIYVFVIYDLTNLI